MFDTLDIGTSGLIAQRTRMDVCAANIAGMAQTKDAQGRPIPYRRKYVEIAAGAAGDSSKAGVHVTGVKEDQGPFIPQFMPGDPNADKNGYIYHTNVDLAIEQVNSLEASRAYEANVTMMETTKAMFNSSLRLIA